MGMAPPGVRVPVLRLDRQGQWSVDGERIEHERTVAVLTQNVRIDGGRAFTNIGREVAPIVVDDTPYFVTSLALSPALSVRLSDGTVETLRSPRAAHSDDGRLYLLVKDGSLWALVARAVHHQLEECVEEKDGVLGLALPGGFVVVEPAVPPMWTASERT